MQGKLATYQIRIEEHMKAERGSFLESKKDTSSELKNGTPQGWKEALMKRGNGQCLKRKKGALLEMPPVWRG